MLIFLTTIEVKKINIRTPMQNLKILQDNALPQSRLAALGITKDEVIQIVQEAVAAKNNAIAIDPINTPGLLAYVYGTRALRAMLMPKGWRLDRTNNIEAVVNGDSTIKLLYQNTDSACDASREPRAISGKGPASSRMIAQAQGDLFPDLLEAELKQVPTPAIWFLCVSINENGVQAELSRPKAIEGGQYKGFHERIFIINKGEWNDLPPLVEKGTHNDAMLEDDFEITITRK